MLAGHAVPTIGVPDDREETALLESATTGVSEPKLESVRVRDGGSPRRTPIRFALEPVPPFRLDLTVWALRRRPHNAIDRWDGHTYGRALRLRGQAVAEVEVHQTAPPESPRLVVSVAADRPVRQARTEVTAVLQRMLGLDVDLSDFYHQAGHDPHLRPLVQRFRGLKPPRFPSLFECLANAIACQQLTLTVGIELLNRLTERYGRAAGGASGTAPRAFPDPADLTISDTDTVRSLGFSTAKAHALIELAQRISEGGIDLERLAAADDQIASAALQRLRGIGRWSAEYALLRGLGRLAVFPADDVGARNNLQRFLGVDPDMDYEAVRRAVAPWAPSAGFVYFHLLLDRVDRAGWLTDASMSSCADAT
jgi:DNA-3-methyladenine glycosylase II